MSENDQIIAEKDTYPSTIEITSSFCYGKLKQYFTNESACQGKVTFHAHSAYIDIIYGQYFDMIIINNV